MSRETGEKQGVTRRDFLGLAAFGSAILASIGALAGGLRFVKADLYSEESKKFKIGRVENFPVGITRKIDEKNVFIFSDDDGLYAISAVCTHLGCIVSLAEYGFQCPCHGSQYTQDGNVIGGPAPRPLEWFEIDQEVDGNLFVNAGKAVPQGTKYLFA
jgi:cytochrome b6-f complex iron-sulfur subunit